MFKKISILIIFCALILGLGVLGVKATTTSAPSTLSIADYTNYSLEDLQALVARLQSIIADKKTGRPCFISDTDLSFGDGEDDASNAGIRRLQAFLKEKGYASFGATGYFGKLTKASLMAYQKAFGLDQTGEFSGATREKIHAMKCRAKAFLTAVKAATNSAAAPSPVNSITVSGSGNKVTWTVDGKSSQGFKIVWSKNSEPAYPTREGDKYIYLTDPSVTSTELDAFSGSGTYFVRVCEYLGGKCGKYSNQISVSL